MREAFIALGSNVGDRLDYFAKALTAISDHPENVLLNVSNVYETDPVGFTNQARFLNAVIQIKTKASPLALLDFLQHVELQLGRRRETRWGPRTIDLDILAIERLYYNSPLLKVPHAHVLKRLFVLKPLADIAPYFEIFGAKGDVITIIEKVDESSRVDYFLSSNELMKLSREE